MIKHVYDTPVGPLYVEVDEAKLTHCDWQGFTGARGAATVEDEMILRQFCEELDRYFVGELKRFHTPYHLRGTAFQEKVWRAIAEVEPGHTITYGQLASAIGSEKAVRAVAGACGANPVCIIVPCHRIVASGGIGGYTGGIHIKRALLDLETPLAFDTLGIEDPYSK